MRFIHIADLHLGSSPEAEFLWGKNRAEEIWDSFAAVIDACNEKEIDLLLIAGDLFDRPPVWADLDRAAKLFARLTATEVVMIAGASDYITEDSPWKTYPWQSWVHMLSDKHCMNVQLGNINTSVHGCSYYAPTEGKPYLEDARPDKESEYQILLGYTGDDNHMPADLSELSEKGFDYIALGHIHRPEMIEPDRMAYAGALEPIDQNDIGPHGFIEGKYNEGKLSISFVPWACREYIPLELDTKECPTNLAFQETVRMRMAAKGMQHIYKVLLQGYRDPDIVYDLDACRKLGNIVSVQDESVPDYDFERLMRVHAGDIAGRYIQTLYHKDMSDTERKALYYGIHALLEMRG